MEEIRPARRSSGVYDANMENHSQPSFNSQASLRAHAAAPAGGYITAGTPGAVLSGWDDNEPSTTGPSAAAGPVTAASSAPKQPFYKKRCFIISQIILIPLGIILLFVLLFPVVRAIVALVVKRTNLDVQAAIITQPVNNSFGLHLEGNVLNTGIISATIKFTENITVTWIEDDGTSTPLGFMQLAPLSAKHKRAVINQTTTFSIQNETAFGRFSAHLITAQNFTWRLQSHNLRVQALKFPVAKGITFDKTITLNGFDNFNNKVGLQNLQLPGDDPAGGIEFIAETSLVNPSPFSLDLGTVVFALTYQNVSLGIGTGTNTVIAPGNNIITLVGTLKPQTDPNDLATVSQLFTNYLNAVNSPVIATGVSTLQSDGSAISWLSTGLQSLALTVPFKPLAPINPIHSVSIGDLSLVFDENNAFAPMANSKSVIAGLQLPFGFSISIGEIQNDFTIVDLDGNPVAGLSTGLGASTSSISVLNSTDTTGTINITIDNTRLTSPDNQHAAFSAFNTNLTNSNVTDFFLVGTSKAIANLSIGQITLDGIAVNVTTTLDGLDGLKNSTTIDTVDVVGGTSAGIELDLAVTIFNPSNLELVVGDLTLQLARDGVVLGTTLLPNLTLARGNNSAKATSSFAANSSPQGQQTLDDFVSHKDVQLTISGFSNSTNIASLLPAFETISIDVILPALKTDLLNTADLTILPTTGTANNISHVTVSIANPFSAPLEVTQVSSSVSAFGIPLGTINQTVNFTSAPKSTTTSPQLDLDMNFEPAALFTVTRALAVEAGLDVAPLDQIVSLAGIQYLPITQTSAPSTKRDVTKRDNIFTGFDLPTFVQAAFKMLKSDVLLTTGITIGDYPTTLELSQLGVPTATDKTIDIILPILAAPIVQKVVGGSVLGLDTVNIIDPAQNSFKTALKGSITNAGPFDANISFPSGLTISWEGKPIGQVSMNDIQVTGDVGGTIDSEANFVVADVDHLADFTKALLTTESFEWEISGENLTVNALGISVPGITFASRTVTLKGFNGLVNGVTINSFNLPANDPAGGIHLTIETTVNNPAQVGIELSSLGFMTFASNIMIAPVTSISAVTLAPGSSSNLSLAGRLIPQTTADGLASVSDIFNKFIQGEDSDVMVQGSSAGSGDVTWLNEGIKALNVATVLPNQGKLNIIESIDLNQLTLIFSSSSPFSPMTSSSSTDAAFTLPFGFPVDITALQQTITLGFSGVPFGQLAIPKGPSTTDVDARIIHLGFSNVPLEVSDNGQSTFDQFVAATTTGSKETLQLSGSADADANTAVGLISLKNINFAVNSDIAGLQGLNTRPVTIADLDVNHGFPDFLLIKVNSSLFNPSNLTIGTGDVSFDLQFQDETIGSADIANLVIVPGNASYPIDVHFAPQGGTISAGNTLLENFIQGSDSNTVIAGTTESTSIQSLQSALAQIHLSPVTIPGLKETLIKSASLSFPTDIVNTGVAATSFTLANPFTASINLLQVAATATFHNLTLGQIPNVDVSSNPIVAAGHNSVTSMSLPLNFNLDASTIIQLLLITSQLNNVGLGPLTDLFQFVLSNPDFKPPVTSSVDSEASTCVSGKQFDVDGAILNSLAGLKVDLAVESSVKLDDFATELSFAQIGVPAIVDKTVLFLIGAVAGPVAQHLVDGSILSFSQADIMNISNEGFNLQLKGALTNVGPLDALITFMEPVNVNWQGKDIATITLPPICAAANAGVPDYEATASLLISSQKDFTDFATFLLHNPSFEWTISTPKLRVTALGTIFDNISLSKVITLRAFNGLPGVTINNFQLPSDDPVGGIHIETGALIPSSAQVGINLGTVTFQSFFEGTPVGPLSATGLSLAPNSETPANLSGRIVPQSGADLDKIGTLFSQFLNGENATLQTTGQSVQPPGTSGTINWLTTAFQSLTLDVVLPGQKLQVIKEIDLNDLEVTLKTDEQTFAPPTSSHNTVAKYANPFGFSLQVIQAGQTIVLGKSGVQIAKLVIPSTPSVGGVSTGNLADLNIVFTDIPLQAIDQAAFTQLFAAVTLTSQVEIDLSGTADVIARTSIGDVPIAAIPIDVQSSLSGINAFGGTAALSNVSVTGSGGVGGSQFIVSPLTTILQNPSNVSLDTINVALPVIFNGVMIGRAAINEFDLQPGENVIPTEFHYEPADANDTVAQSFLSEFIQTGNSIDLSIAGDADSTPFASLQGALSGLKLSTSLGGLNQPNIITVIHVSITLDSLVTNLVSVDFNVFNPLDVDLVIEFVQSDAGVMGQTFAQFSQGFDSFVVPPGQTVNSGVFGNVLLTQGAIAALGIVPLGVLDVQAGVTVRVGQGGYEVPFLQLQQTSVPTQYALLLDSFSDEKAKPAVANSSSSSTTSSASGSSSAAPIVDSTAAQVATSETPNSTIGLSPPSSKAALPVPVPSPSAPAPAASTAPAVSPGNDPKSTKTVNTPSSAVHQTAR